MRSKRILIGVLAVALALLVVCLIPIEQAAVPEWRIQIVNEAGSPVASVDVHEEWMEFGPESHTMVDIRPSDATGWVTFPPRTSRGSILYRLLIHPIGSEDANGVAPSAHVFVCWNDLTGEVQWESWSGVAPRARLVLHKGGCGYG
jgi:hypothetical protein